MRINVDLHLHSNYSPGVFNMSLEKVAYVAGLRGVNLLGTGDCLFPKWRNYLEKELIEVSEGIFSLKNITRSYYGLEKRVAENTYFVLQTELIFTFASPGEKQRKRMDVIVLFPSFSAVDSTVNLLSKWGVKNTTGRPFVLCKKAEEVGERIGELLTIDPEVEVVPAHIMTPEGVFGSRNNINSLRDVLGDVLLKIHAVETGLSADLEILSLIPELDNLTLISNSDAHSAELNAIGRESTVIEVKTERYSEIIAAIRENKVVYTVEFPPSEGKYFFTGHRGDRPGHKGKPCYFSPLFTPLSKECPICGKKLNIGVLERAFELQKIQGGQRKFGELKNNARPFIRIVPLIKILQINKTSEKVYLSTICKEFGNELQLWQASIEEAEEKLRKINIEEKVVRDILKVKKGEYCFNPPGYDGEFGKFRIGEKIDIFQIKEGLKEGIERQPKLF